MNRVLARQLRRLGLSPEELPQDLESWAELLDRVGAFYEGADRSRYVLERSMEISSREMQGVNQHIRDLARREMQRQELLSQHNFNELPVAAWLEDYRGVVHRLDDLREFGVEDLPAYLDANPEALRDLIGRVVILDCNPMVTELVGATREDLLGSINADDLSTDSLVSWSRQFQAMWDGDSKAEIEFTGERSDGSPFSAILHWSVASIDGEPDFSRVMVVIIDISDRIEAEEKMRQLVVAKDEFLASVSHELRTPLTSVIGYSQVLLDETLDDRERAAMLSTVVDQASDLSNIVDDLLVGARAELGQLDVKTAPVDIAAVVDGCLRSFPYVNRIGDRLEDVYAIGDPARIRQILRNLLTNAERYGGDDVVICPTVVSGDSIEIAVCDSGPALPAGLSGKVFERYYREQGESRPTGSVGIGLTIARDLAHKMNGDLTYRHDGEWSEFVLTLPRAARRLRAVS